MDAQPESATNTQPEPLEKKRSFPSAPTILVVVILLVWIATFFIPSGQYARDADGQPVPGSWEPTDLGLTFMDRVGLLFESPPNGLYGVQDLETGVVGPWNVGVLFGGAQVHRPLRRAGAGGPDEVHRRVR